MRSSVRAARRALLWSALAVACGGACAADAPAKAATCTACHGAAGVSAMAETPSLAGQPEGFLQWQLVYFRSGTRASPIMQPLAASLGDDDIRALAAWFSKQTPPALEAAGSPVDETKYEVGRKLAQANRCASCHKDDYSGTQATARTAHQREDYLLKALRDFKSGKRTGGGVAAMADVVYPLGDEQLQALAHYMAHLH